MRLAMFSLKLPRPPQLTQVQLPTTCVDDDLSVLPLQLVWPLQPP